MTITKQEIADAARIRELETALRNYRLAVTQGRWADAKDIYETALGKAGLYVQEEQK